MTHFTEKELQEKVMKLISEDKLLDSISNVDVFNKKIKNLDQEGIVPNYEIDFWLRTKYLKSISQVLESLEIYDIITGDKIKNVSIQNDRKKKERLYPDILLGNPEDHSIIILELKKDSQTEREAITELMAYALEIKNHLPHIADTDIPLIIIAKNYTTLLAHAIGTLLMGTRFNILALKIGNENDAFSLEIHEPDNWTDIWQNTLPENAFLSINLTGIVKETDNELPPESVIYDVISDLVLSEGNLNGSHGFLFLWRNMLILQNNKKDFGLTICQINPYLFLQASIERKFDLKTTEPLSQYILKINKETSPYNHSGSMMKIVSRVKTFLENYFTVQIEDLTTWDNLMQVNSYYRYYALPFMFNSWGNIGEYLREFYFNPIVVERFMGPNLLKSPFLYFDSIYGFEMVNRLTGKIPFDEGEFRVKDLYKYGKLLRNYWQISDQYYSSKIAKKSFELLKPRLFYASIELVGSNREIVSRINTSNLDIVDYTPCPLHIRDINEDITPKMHAYFEWFIKSFLKDSPIHQKMFNDFFQFNSYFNDEFKELMDKNQEKQLEKDILVWSKNQLAYLLEGHFIEQSPIVTKDIIQTINTTFCLTQIDEIPSKNDISNRIENINEKLILENFETVILDLVDKTTFEVFHLVNPMSPEVMKNKDWSLAKKQLKKRFEEGHKYAAIILGAGGQITYSIIPETHRVYSGIVDPNKEVFIASNFSGIQTIRKTTWEEIESGAFFDKNPV